MNLTVAGLWRYPVKSLAGEALTIAEVTKNGIIGDRRVHVRGPEGVRTSRRQHRMLGLQATLAMVFLVDDVVLGLKDKLEGVRNRGIVFDHQQTRFHRLSGASGRTMPKVVPTPTWV